MRAAAIAWEAPVAYGGLEVERGGGVDFGGKVKSAGLSTRRSRVQATSPPPVQGAERMSEMSKEAFGALPDDERAAYLAKFGLREEKCRKCGNVAFISTKAPPGGEHECRKCMPPIEIACHACGAKSINTFPLVPGEGVKCLKCGHVMREP